MVQLPPHFVRTITDVHGAAGTAWLETLGMTLQACARRWDLTVAAPFGLTYNYVAPAWGRGGAECVLKLGPPGSPDLRHEAAVLSAISGDGAARVLDFDAALGALLLERVRPGDALWSVPPAADREATAAIASVLQRWWRPVPPGLDARPLAELALGFDRYRAVHGDGGPVPAALVAAAADVWHDMLSTTQEEVLLHGDLHHGNVLRSARQEWLAIDPKGLAGDAVYDCASMLSNPHHVIPAEPDLRRLLTTRAADLAGVLGLDQHRILAWGFAHAVLSEVWSVEDHGATSGVSLLVAQALRP